MSKLSEDLLFEILSWLPVSSLLRFRFVCKPWFSLITQNPSFVKLHLLRANATQIDNPKVLFIPHRNGTLCSLNYVDIASSSPNVYENLVNDPAILKRIHFVDTASSSPSSIYTSVYANLMKDPESLNIFNFEASCNGLICISRFETNVICLWNPSTGEIKGLPEMPYKHPARWHRFIASGFGCNHTLDDYKVIRIIQYPGNKENYIFPVWDDKEENLYFDVYTLGTNSWKRIRDMPCKFSRRADSRGLHLNGRLHWRGSISLTESNDGIISFDIEDEKYREVPKPQCWDSMDNAKLQVLGGCLCVFKFVSEDCLDVWIMKDYGVKESWTKLFTTSQFRVQDHHGTLNPLWLFKHGQVLMTMSLCNKDLALYDPKCDTFEYIGPQPFNFGRFDTVIYIESLVSLESGTYAYQHVTSSKEKKCKKKMKKKRRRQC